MIGPAVGDDPFDLDGVAGLDRRQRRRAGVDRALGDQLGQVGHRQVRADGLDPGAADGQVDQVARRPRTAPPARTGPGRARTASRPAHVPRRRHDPVQLDRPTRPGLTPAGSTGRRDQLLAVVFGVWSPGRRPGWARRPASAAARPAAVPAAARAPGRTGPPGLTGRCASSAWCGRSALYSATQRVDRGLRRLQRGERSDARRAAPGAG